MDRAAVQLNEAFHQRQSEAGPLGSLALRPVRLAELLEDDLMVFGIDADALVFDANLARRRRRSGGR